MSSLSNFLSPHASPEFTNASPGRRRRILLALAALLVGLVSLTTSVGAQAQTGQSRLFYLEINGVINELTADHILRVVRKAEDEQAHIILLQLNSPGGTDSAIQRLNQSFLSSTVPVIVYVNGPEEPEALSGAFLDLLAAHRAAASPEAMIGATPTPGLSERIDPEEREERIESAIEIATRTADLRGRPVSTVVDLIREQDAVTADEALDLGLIDFITEDLTSLITRIDGEEIETTTGVVMVDTTNARIVPIEMTSWERLLQFVTNPTVAYILLSTGLLLLVVELYVSGWLIAGLVGIILTALAFIAFGNLPFSWLGISLIVLAMLLFIGELRTPWIGILGALGLIAHLLGSLALYRPINTSSPFAPDVTVDPLAMVAMTSAWIIMLLIMLRALFRVRVGSFETDESELVGHTAIVTEQLAPRGIVRLHDQEWSALTETPVIDEGTLVLIEDIRGGVLHVNPVPANSKSELS